MRWIGIILSCSLVGAYMDRLLPLWYPLLPYDLLSTQRIHKITIGSEPFVCYRSDDRYIVHSDICPHQGASLAKGWVNRDGNIQCPYHGFEFTDGVFSKIPDPSKNLKPFRSKICLPSFPSTLSGGNLYVLPFTNHSHPPLFFPPEETDPAFSKVSGVRHIDTDAHLVVENLLDMLHISYVHSFGSRLTPLASDIKYKRTSPTSGKTTFCYTANDNTISNRWGGSAQVIVENEFHLPTTTITRVFAGNNLIKTVFTQTLPTGPGQCVLFWNVYRNFWRDPTVNLFSMMGDVLLRFLMEKTINEDVSILQNVYPNQKNTLITKYDVTIQEFRRCYATYPTLV